MDQQRLIFDDLDDALREVVRALGGNKAVGAKLRAELPAEQAANWLRDCLTSGRREKLDGMQILAIMRWGREAGCHTGMHFLCDEAGYERAKPVSPEDKAAQLIERAGQLARESRGVADALDRLSRVTAANRS